MNLIVWNESLNTEIPIIDNQHKTLVNKINELYECIETNATCEYLKIMLQSLVDYTYYHFETEERFFNKYEYPDKIMHLKEHENFKEDVERFMKKNNENSRELALEILSFLNSWLFHHIKHVDMDYASFLKEKLMMEN